jgi:hypothetical protein
MALNDIAICSRALIRLGAQPISSFDDGSVESEICGALYAQSRDALLSAYGWSFATGQVELSALDETPSGEYRNVFALPNDYLRALTAGSGNGSTSGLDYRIMHGKLYCNSVTVLLTYIYRANESEFPPYFDSILISRMAAELCIPLTENTSRFDTLMRLAETEFSRARQLDAQQHRPQRLKQFPLTDVRG